ncbi:hypothetical protein QLS91_02320 [Flavobacterium sp. LB2P84]|uniref:hypothetical protein n=1 Tax=Flavobacterium yafengii TaxID=3041253 RepID=UPI0024A92593|nr:hypothetical protein [Flavobacterium yafengii]MDI6031901.1 hypothetical protein [Flavobacterium yafengii]
MNEIITQSHKKYLLAPQDINSHHTETKADVLSDWKEEFTKRIQTESNSRKELFSFNDAYQKPKYHTKRDKVFLSVESFLRSEPLQKNDYVKFVSCYITTGSKLDKKYFKNDLKKLNEYYKKVDEAKAKGETFNPFSLKAYKRYVLFMVLKFSGEYTSDLDEAFGVQAVGHRVYNPLTKIPSVLRGELPFKVKEYDIKRAYPAFIDIELNTNHRATIYEIIDKKTFAYLLNSNVTNKDADRNIILKELSKAYGNDADKVCTPDRFNNKGGAFMDFSRHEKEYIERFVTENDLVNYVRLHDGVFVLAETICKNIQFGKVEFSIKECVKPPIENEIVNFYTIDENNKVCTSPTMYADFFIQEKFLRISTPDDKIYLLRDTNNVVNYFSHKTDTVSYLKSNINEFGNSFSEVADTIARENFSGIIQGFLLIPSLELNYYSDTKNTFGLPFSNGFFEFNGTGIICKEYTDVNGFFAPHEIQSREFKYTDEVGMFEQFLIRASIGRIEPNTQNTENIVESFKTMFGYLCHNYKDMTKNPCIVLTDMDADDETRNGRRGKTLISKAVQEVQESIIKGGKEFDSNYTFVFADLEKKHNVYIIDDVPAGFKYDDLYTNILGDISAQRKGLKAETIKFKDAPKFVITSNWVVPYDGKNASTNGRFIEYKFTNYYTTSHTPKDEFSCVFFQDWNADEWNRFYSFVFRCVKLYLQKGIIKTEYDKTDDNYRAYFNNDAVHSEFHRIIDQFVDDPLCTEFTVTSFLNVYNDTLNPLRFEKMFTTRNTKRLIDAWVGKFNLESIDFGIEYSQRTRNWIKK